MAILPNNVDPSKDYVSQTINPPLTSDGLVYNKIYAQTGVVDTLSNILTTGYRDPNIKATNQSNGVLTFDPASQTSWFSSTDFGGPNSAPVIVTYDLINTTYYNNLTFDILNVPCYVELLDQYGNNLPGASTFVIAGGGDIYTTTDWLRLEYIAPSNNYGSFGYPLTGMTSIAIRITRQKEIQTASVGNLLTNVAYSVGLRNFNIQLIVKSTQDIPYTVRVSGTNSIITQNRFGFVENYSYSTNSLSNMFVNDSTYWKCAPQPVKDSVIFFYAKVSDPSPTSINRIYIDPIYSSCKFNIYYTNSSTNNGTVDPSSFYWTPIQREFTLRKGIYEIPNVSCTYLKFEFVKLIAEAYDLPVDSVDRTIDVFPYDVEQYFADVEQNIINANPLQYSYYGQSNLATQTQASNQLSSSTLFGIANQTIGSENTGWPQLSSLNNSQLGNTTTLGPSTSSTITDPSISYKIIDTNGNYNYQTYNEFLQRRFPDTRVHEYTQVNIKHSWHEAYFTGIRYLTTFYETSFDDLRGTPTNLLSSNLTNSGFPSQDTNYVMLNVDQAATTPWFSTIDSFNAFNIGGLTTDWRSFLTQGASLNNDPTIMNGLSQAQITAMQINSTVQENGTLGLSKIYSVIGNPATNYGIKSGSYLTGTNLANYYNANYLPYSGSILGWTAGSGTTITGTSVIYYNPTTHISGTASGLSVSGGSYSASFNFTIPNVNASGIDTWKVQFGAPSFGAVGFASYSPASGLQYYFLTNVQASGSTNISLKTQFVNPTNNSVISGTTVSGSNLAVTSGINIATVTGTNYKTSIPSNTIQLVISGSAAVPYSLYQLGIFSVPTTTWIGPSDHSNMRISGVVRTLLPKTNFGTYRASLMAVDLLGNTSEISYRVYAPQTLPLNTWFDIQLEGYTGTNYTNFYMQLVQVSNTVNEIFYVSMIAPFYHPVRYEYTNTYGTSITSNQGWYPITTGVNSPDHFISTVSGIAASGIQVRMTALDPNVYISGISIIPQYKQNAYYANLNIDYIGSSKTNEISIRRDISSKPYFQLNQNVYPSVFNINRISNTVNIYELS